MPRYNYIDNNSVGLTIDNASGIASCEARCYTSSGYTVRVDAHLQRYMGTYWVTLQSWTKTATGNAKAQGSWAVYSGYTYRTYAEFSIYNSAGTLLETGTNYKTVSYPKS